MAIVNDFVEGEDREKPEMPFTKSNLFEWMQKLLRVNSSVLPIL